MFFSSSQNKNSHALVGWLLLAFAVLLITCSLYATVSAEWWGKRVWLSATNREDFLLLAGGGFLLYFSVLRFGLPFFSLLLLPGLIYVGMSGLAPLTAVLWFWACAVLVGAGILDFLKPTTDQTWTLRHAAVGFAVVGTLIATLAHFPVNIPGLYFALFSALAAAGGWRLARKGRLTGFTWSFSLTRRTNAESMLGAFVMVGVTLVMVFVTLPELGYDALAFHLNIPAKMLETGLWHFDVQQYIWSVMPFGADWLFVPPYFLAGEQGARLLNASFLLAIAFTSYRLLAPRIGTVLALAAPALLLTWPLSFLETASAFIEAPLAFFFLISIAELQGHDSEDKGSWMVLGVAAGYACSIKLLGVLIVPFLLVGALLRSRFGKFERPSIKSFSWGFVAFLVFALPPYFVAFLKTGNPVFPFFNSIFRSPYFITGSMFGNGSDFSNPFYKRAISLHTFWDMSIHSTGFGEFQSPGALGIVLLVLVPLSLLAIVINRRWWILATICSTFAYVILVFHSQAYLRYAFPVLPWLLIIGAWSLSRLPNPTLSGTLIVVILSLLNLARLPVAYWPLQQFELNWLWNRNASAEFFLRSNPEAVVGNIISKMGSYKGKKILILGLNPVYSSFPDGTVTDTWHSWPYYAPSLKDKMIRTSIARSGAEIIVHTIGRGYSREAELMEITTEQFRLGDIRVGLVKPEKLYPQEHISGVDVAANTKNWQLNGATVVSDGVSTTSSTGISQSVAFAPIDWTSFEPNLARVIRLILPTIVNVNPVLLEMQASCPVGESFRSQIRWMDSHNNMISEDVGTYPCNTGESNIRRSILMPGAALTGIVYASSQDERPVTIKRVSLRTPE